MNPISIAEVCLSEEEIEAAVQVLRSGGLCQGEQSLAFEESFAAVVGAKHAVSCASGTAALHLAFASFLRPGDEVLVPTFTFFATASTVVHAGGVPVFCDVDPQTALIDLEDAATRVTPQTRAIAAVHLYGNPCQVREVQHFAEEHNLTILWDAAQAHGAEFEGVGLGAWGPYTTYSFYPSKNMFTGEGGMICTDDEGLAQPLRDLRSHGQTAKYLHTSMGFNYRMTDVEAAIGRRQLERLPAMIEARTSHALRLEAGLQDIPGITRPQVTPGGKHAWHQYCVRVDGERFGMDRDELAGRLHDRQIATGIPYPRGLHQQPVFEERYGIRPLPQAEMWAREVLALPVHHGLGQADIDRIIDSICEIGGLDIGAAA